jgi:hypothetical protein
MCNDAHYSCLKREKRRTEPLSAYPYQNRIELNRRYPQIKNLRQIKRIKSIINYNHYIEH